MAGSRKDDEIQNIQREKQEMKEKLASTLKDLCQREFDLITEKYTLQKELSRNERATYTLTKKYTEELRINQNRKLATQSNCDKARKSIKTLEETVKQLEQKLAIKRSLTAQSPKFKEHTANNELTFPEANLTAPEKRPENAVIVVKETTPSIQKEIQATSPLKKERATPATVEQPVAAQASDNLSSPYEAIEKNGNQIEQTITEIGLQTTKKIRTWIEIYNDFELQTNLQNFSTGDGGQKNIKRFNLRKEWKRLDDLYEEMRTIPQNLNPVSPEKWQERIDNAKLNLIHLFDKQILNQITREEKDNASRFSIINYFRQTVKARKANYLKKVNELPFTEEQKKYYALYLAKNAFQHLLGQERFFTLFRTNSHSHQTRSMHQMVGPFANDAEFVEKAPRVKFTRHKSVLKR